MRNELFKGLLVWRYCRNKQLPSWTSEFAGKKFAMTLLTFLVLMTCCLGMNVAFNSQPLSEEGLANVVKMAIAPPSPGQRGTSKSPSSTVNRPRSTAHRVSNTTTQLPKVVSASSPAKNGANKNNLSNSQSLRPKWMQIAQQGLLDCLTSGEWHKEAYTEAQEKEMKTFLRNTRNQYNMPVPLQRTDGKCGNVAFGAGGLTWFRAVCDPDGATPCCIQDSCQNKTVKECVCENCYDLRQRLYAELSSWKNHDAQCQVRQFSTKEACDVMQGVEIHFIGDSHTRHTYMGLQILLTGDEEYGCMGPNLSPELKTTCRGLYMFTEKVCRERVLSSHVVCDGLVHLNLHELHASVYADRILEVVYGLVGKPGTVVVLGLGHHDSFTAQTVISKVASPVLELLENSSNIWPKIIWLGVHSLGLLKTPVVPMHLNPNVITYNRAMRDFLKTHQVNFMDTFSLTKKISSPDGSHYGKGVNLLKARVLLEFINRIGNVTYIADHTFTNSTILR